MLSKQNTWWQAKVKSHMIIFLEINKKLWESVDYILQSQGGHLPEIRYRVEKTKPEKDTELIITIKAWKLQHLSQKWKDTINSTIYYKKISYGTLVQAVKEFSNRITRKIANISTGKTLCGEEEMHFETPICYTRLLKHCNSISLATVLHQSIRVSFWHLNRFREDNLTRRNVWCFYASGTNVTVRSCRNLDFVLWVFLQDHFYLTPQLFWMTFSGKRTVIEIIYMSVSQLILMRFNCQKWNEVDDVLIIQNLKKSLQKFILFPDDFLPTRSWSPVLQAQLVRK